jgi:GTP-binding protein HflX
MNALTDAEVFVEDRLFATLDPTIRVMTSQNLRKILLIDTVGFIRKLPHHLVASFMSTLQETAQADLLLHVVDVSHPHFTEQMESVTNVLKTLHIDTKPSLTVFNKVDKLEYRGMLPRLTEKHFPCVTVSATRGIYMDKLKKEIWRFAEKDLVECELCIQNDKSKGIAKIHELSEVLSKEYLDGCVQMRIKTNYLNLQKITRFSGVEQLEKTTNVLSDGQQNNVEKY